VQAVVFQVTSNVSPRVAAPTITQARCDLKYIDELSLCARGRPLPPGFASSGWVKRTLDHIWLRSGTRRRTFKVGWMLLFFVFFFLFLWWVVPVCSKSDMYEYLGRSVFLLPHSPTTLFGWFYDPIRLQISDHFRPKHHKGRPFPP
jgi:hypothetical protein